MTSAREALALAGISLLGALTFLAAAAAMLVLAFGGIDQAALGLAVIGWAFL